MEAIQQFIREIIEAAYCEPVRSPDAFKVCEAIGIERRAALAGQSEDADCAQAPMAMSVREEREGGRWIIYHDQTQRPERQQFDVAHEIIEQFLVDNDDLIDTFTCGEEAEDADQWRAAMHEIAVFYTKDFLINRDFFEQDAQEFEGDLAALKGLYPHASHEVLAYALLAQSGPHAVLTIIDEPEGSERKIYRRIRGDMWPMREPLLPEERELIQACFASGEPVRAERDVRIPAWLYEGRIRLRADPVFEPGWKRVVLFLLADQE
ncbi:ImmA/IrrE family metallo-endopeptidase [Candidatus Sumerlaeota bacterium]|nr:ImmA/IrrE family metallo-endopeptidase [Candidatus Sumerlaeota bacterium]